MAISAADSNPAIVWFRRNLRLSDNPALGAAIEHAGENLICLYIFETDDTLRPLGGASKWWLDKSLRTLKTDIEALGGRLILRKGKANETLAKVVQESGANAIFWNRRYDEAGRTIDAAVKSELKAQGLTCESFNGSVLTEPWTQKTGSGGYYKVYSPYWRSVQKAYQPEPVAAAPSKLLSNTLASDDLESWALHPRSPDWSTGFDADWTPGEHGAAARLNAFLSGPVSNYGNDRNRPDLETSTSGLSPHLAFGEVSPAQIWRATKLRVETGQIDAKGAQKFLSEVAWRDFAYVLLFHNPQLASENFKPDFDGMPWEGNADQLKAWQQGRTGYPIVDAGMRELWHTGWMHNRVRMITASFLTKHLMIHWRDGEDWFWNTLVDADPASNSASWQWVAGSGADAAPYFRIFNPITQGEKFDVSGDYVRKWCPELKRLPRKFLYQPWKAGPLILREAGVELGANYPHPIVDHSEARTRALAAYETLKERRDAA
ncbi:MAG: deoxyribodipyrimidine photo-lyase [Henriciella sp.]|nr:deoxyribodipyrimidine photo-lyase [Henriciella sp.]